MNSPSLLDSIHVARRLVCQGVPLHVAISVFPRVNTSALEKVSWPYAFLELVSPKGALAFKGEPAVREKGNGWYVFEIPTEGLAPGPYDIWATVDSDRVKDNAQVLIVTRQQFNQIAKEESEEQFQPSPPLYGQNDVFSFAEYLLRERMQPLFRVPQYFQIIRAKHYSAPQKSDTFPSSVVRWTTGLFADELFDLAVRSIPSGPWPWPDVSGFIEGTLFRLELKSSPQSIQAVLDAKVTPETSFLSLLERYQRPGLTFTVFNNQPGSISVGCSMVNVPIDRSLPAPLRVQRQTF